MENKTYVVTRHEGAVEWLKENYEGFDSAELKSHIIPEEIKGNIIVGTLPIHLAALAKTYHHLILSLPPEARGKELTKEDMEKYGAKIQQFIIHPITPSQSDNPFKTKGYISDGHANRYREYHKVLNPSDVISQKEVFNKNGKWSTTTITYFYSKPLYILTYYHSTHPGDGVFKIYKEENGEREEIYSLSTDDDYIDPKEFPPQFNQVEILEFMDEHIPNFKDTTSLIQRSLRLGTLPKSFKSKK